MRPGLLKCFNILFCVNICNYIVENENYILRVEYKYAIQVIYV